MDLNSMKLIPAITNLVREMGNTDTPPAKFFFGHCKMSRRERIAWRLFVTVYLFSIAAGSAVLFAYLFNLIGTWPQQ
jgi:hypothetical protein